MGNFIDIWRFLSGHTGGDLTVPLEYLYLEAILSFMRSLARTFAIVAWHYIIYLTMCSCIVVKLLSVQNQRSFVQINYSIGDLVPMKVAR